MAKLLVDELSTKINHLQELRVLFYRAGRHVQAALMEPDSLSPVRDASWGYRRMHGKLLLLGVKVAASTVGDIIKTPA